MPRYPNVHTVLITLLSPVASTVKAKHPGQPLPYNVVRRIGGAEDGITDRPIVRVDNYAATDEQAEEMKEACRQAITEAGGTLVGDVLIDTAREISGGHDTPAPDPSDRKQTAVYQLSFRAL
ncbi:phage tail termination protein [Nocardia sp. NPDC004278]